MKAINQVEMAFDMVIFVYFQLKFNIQQECLRKTFGPFQVNISDVPYNRPVGEVFNIELPKDLEIELSIGGPVLFSPEDDNDTIIRATVVDLVMTQDQDWKFIYFIPLQANTILAGNKVFMF